MTWTPPRRQTVFRPLCLLLILCAGPDQASAASELTSEQIRQSASRVMQQRDYRAVRRRVLENVSSSDANQRGGFLQRSLGAIGTAVNGFFRWLLSGLNSSRTAAPGRAVRSAPASPEPPPRRSTNEWNLSFGRLLLLSVLAALVATITWLVAAALTKTEADHNDHRRAFEGSRGATDVAVPPGERAVSSYESRAIQLATDENFGPAIRELLLGSMSWIERTDWIRFRRGLTNRDYVRAVYRDPDRRLAYHAMALEFERVYFGRRPGTRRAFEICLAAFQGAFREQTDSDVV